MKDVFQAAVSQFGEGKGLEVDPKVWVFLGLFVASDLILYNKRFDGWCKGKAMVLRWVLYFGMIFSIIVFSSVENFPFIYFQF